MNFCSSSSPLNHRSEQKFHHIKAVEARKILWQFQAIPRGRDSFWVSDSELPAVCVKASPSSPVSANFAAHWFSKSGSLFRPPRHPYLNKARNGTLVQRTAHMVEQAR